MRCMAFYYGNCSRPARLLYVRPSRPYGIASLLACHLGNWCGSRRCDGVKLSQPPVPGRVPGGWRSANGRGNIECEASEGVRQNWSSEAAHERRVRRPPVQRNHLWRIRSVVNVMAVHGLFSFVTKALSTSLATIVRRQSPFSATIVASVDRA